MVVVTPIADYEGSVVEFDLRDSAPPLLALLSMSLAYLLGFLVGAIPLLISIPVYSFFFLGLSMAAFPGAEQH